MAQMPGRAAAHLVKTAGKDSGWFARTRDMPEVRDEKQYTD